MVKTYHAFFDEVLRKSLAFQIAELIDRCPGNCGKEAKIEFIRKEFPSLEWDELIEKLKEVRSLDDFVKESTDQFQSQKD